ncbi:MAG: HAMP domain-containing histidine kinase [Bacteroidota bacterium]|nr:HAMP domain-containing histidine kinase [Bacteroidota bacterium]
MSRKVIRNVIILATISILGIGVTQFYWISKAWDIKEKQFNHSVNVSLRNVATDILRLRGDSSAYIEPIKHLSANYFVVSIYDTLHPYLLESLLKAEFTTRNLSLDFEYGIYDCFTDSMVYGNYVPLSSGKREIKPTYLPVKSDKDGHYFGVYFPEKDGYLVSQMGIWLFSTVILLVVMVFFSYTIFVILKQKRLSEITTDFINNMTHEFKTPISTIAISSEVLTKPEIVNNPDRLQRYSSIISEENNRLKSMVERLLQIATLDKADYKLNKTLVNVHSVVGEITNRFVLALNEKNGQFIYKLNATEEIIHVDKEHFTNILSNLVDNAIKYSPGEPVITIITENYRKGIKIKISDNGIGIKKEDQKQVFEKFYRVSTGNLHDIKGFGLGLNYVKIMVEAHKGKVSVESEVNKGSRFEIYLPKK